jgi:glycosyltransferase involved in cell wall biosynthesis
VAWTPLAVPLVFATFQNIAKRYPPPFNWIERRVLGRADAVIAFGRTVRDVLDTRRPKPAQIRVIPPGVDTARFAPDRAAGLRVRHSLGWSDDTPVIGFVGRLVEEKGIGWLTRVLEQVERPWRALIVGAGPLEPGLRAWAAGRPQQVAIETGVRHDDVPRWLNAMDLLCAPSATTARWREQFGRMLIEAFACGVPVVASASGEMPHVVAEAGVLLPERDAAAWKGTVEQLLGNPAVRRQLGAVGRRRAVTVYDWAVVAAAHAALFDELLAEPVVTAASA